jgi:hypothetical protein
MSDLPVISVITSCFNCAPYVESTIRSVVQQEYPGEVEYIFIDAASTDQTLAIAGRYAESISVLLSEDDAGQYHGIQKGMEAASGEVMAWLNGDDVYFPWTFSIVGEIFRKYPEVEWVIGTPGYMNARGECTRISANAGTAYPREYIRNGWFRKTLAGYLQQESIFWRRSLWHKAGGLNLNLKYAADFDLWRRFAEHAELYSIAAPLALFRQRPGEQRSSTGMATYEEEVRRVCSGLQRPPRLWEALGSRGAALRNACRQLAWKRCGVIVYSAVRQEWILTQRLRPLARTSLAEALLLQ